jgi:hypothetical protein
MFDLPIRRPLPVEMGTATWTALAIDRVGISDRRDAQVGLLGKWAPIKSYPILLRGALRDVPMLRRRPRLSSGMGDPENLETTRLHIGRLLCVKRLLGFRSPTVDSYTRCIHE